MTAQPKNKFAIHPKKLFLIDSLGAFLTAFFLFFVLKGFDEFFGVPEHILNYLSAITIVFFLYSFACFFYFPGKNWKPFLRIIIAANLLYALLTLSLVIYHSKTFALPGIIYFALEIIVIIGLVSVEIRTLKSES